MVSILGITEVERDTPVIAKANPSVPVVDANRVVYLGTVETMKFYAHLAMNAAPRIMGGGSSGTILVCTATLRSTWPMRSVPTWSGPRATFAACWRPKPPPCR